MLYEICSDDRLSSVALKSLKKRVFSSINVIFSVYLPLPYYFSLHPYPLSFLLPCVSIFKLLTLNHWSFTGLWWHFNVPFQLLRVPRTVKTLFLFLSSKLMVLSLCLKVIIAEKIFCYAANYLFFKGCQK